MKKIVIAPNRTFNDLYSFYRKDDPFIDVKFMTKEEVIKESLYQYDNNSIFYIVKTRGYDFSLAKRILNDLIYPLKSGSPRLDELIELKNELLERNLLKKNEYFDYELSNASIDVHFYSKKDQELAYFLKKYIDSGNVKFYEYKPRTDFIVNAFNTHEDELCFMMNEIANLIKSGVKPNDIYVYGLNNEYSLVFERLRKNFGLYFNNYNPHLISELPLVEEFLTSYNEETDLEGVIRGIEPKDDDEAKFKDVLLTYLDRDLDYVSQRRTYIDVLNKTYRKKVRYENGVNVINEPFSKEGTHLFILNFAVGKYPRVKKDNGYLSDNEKVMVGLPSLEEINFALSELYQAYLSTKANLHVSYSLLNAEEHLNPSYFIKTLGLKENYEPHQSVISSKEEARVMFGKENDIKKNYRLETKGYQELATQLKIDYNIYDNSFKKFDYYTFKQQLKLSYSQMSTYVKCGFMYYLSYILKVDEYENDFNRERGNIGHAVLERINENTKLEDFDRLYDEEIEKSTYEFTSRDLFFLELMRPYFKKSFEFILHYEGNVYNPVFYREKQLYTPLNDNVSLVGTLDKIVVSGDRNQYISVIDYKSGGESFKENYMQYGLSLQLPTYTVLLKNRNEFKEKEIIGLFIEPLFNPDIKKFTLNHPKYDDGILLKGVFLDDIDKVSTIAGDIKETKVVGSLKLKQDGTLGKNNRAKTEEWFNEKYDVALNRILDTADAILNNKFDINPKIIGVNNVSCTYCHYRDICYKRIKDEVILSTEEDEQNGVE